VTAAEFGQAEVARWLLDVGANVNAPALIDSEGLGGQTPIFHAATQNGNFGIELVRLFFPEEPISTCDADFQVTMKSRRTRCSKGLQ
jgi:ankyrin repeat protein